VLSGTVTGATKQGALTPITLAYSLEAQDAHQQLSARVDSGEQKTINIPTNLGGPVATPSKQTFLVVTCDVANVEITLNSGGVPVGPFIFPKANGVLILPGQVGAAPGLPVADVLVNNSVGGTQRASVSVTTIYGP